MTRLVTTTIAIAAGISFLTSDSAAQAAPPGFGFGGVGGVVTVSTTIDERDWGAGFEGALRYTWAGGPQVVGGFTFNALNVEGIDDGRSIIGGFGDVRLALNPAATIAPFIGGRVASGRAKLSTTILNQPIEATSNGWNFGGLVGVYVEIIDALSFEADLFFGYATFGDQKRNGTTIPDTGTSGTTASLKAGLVYTFIQ